MLSIKGNKSNLLKGKRITLCVTGSVACIEAPKIARELMRHGADVFPVMSESAEHLITKELMEWACENPVVTKLSGEIEHVRLGAYSDLVLVCPSTANTISKIACGIDDTPVTSTVSCAIGAKKPVIIVPAMHDSMYKHPIVKENIKKLKRIGVEFIGPRMIEGKAKIALNEDIADAVLLRVGKKDMKGKRMVVTAGPTFERIDAVRGITNMSSGMMGIELAKNAAYRGADVTLVYGPGRVTPPKFLKTIYVESADEMLKQTLQAMRKANILISCAAIADYTPTRRVRGKIDSSKPLTLKLKQTKKLVSEARKRFPRKTIIAFKLETKRHVEKAREKMKRDKLDMIIANDISAMGSDRNKVYIITKDKMKTIGPASKPQIASAIIDEIAKGF